jgi:hypothetical protein
MKVYVLVRDSICNTDNTEIKVRTYASIIDARATMRKEYKAELDDWKATYALDMFEDEISANSRSIWEKGRYVENHISWEIQETEVL